MKLAYFECNSGKTISKSYNIKELYIDRDSKTRLWKLKKYGKFLYPKVKISNYENTITITQSFIENKIDILDIGARKLFDDFPQKLAFLQKIELVHGDIKLSNLAYDRNQLSIFDWEPALLSIDYIGKLQIRSSKFSAHPQDLLDKKISFKSDLKGMALVLLQSMLGRAQGAKAASKFSAKIDRLISKEHNPVIVAAKIKDLFNLDQSTQSEDIF
jgi:serine/threonine protein kinase